VLSKSTGRDKLIWTRLTFSSLRYHLPVLRSSTAAGLPLEFLAQPAVAGREVTETYRLALELEKALPLSRPGLTSRAGLPLEGAKLRQALEVPSIRRDHRDAGASCAGSNQGVVRQPCLSNPLVSILLRQPGKNSPAWVQSLKFGTSTLLALSKSRSSFTRTGIFYSVSVPKNIADHGAASDELLIGFCN
jgi:hypothetical protein